MGERIGPWDVYGATGDERDAVRATSRRSTYPWAKYLGDVVVLRFRARGDMPRVPGSDIPSEGYAPRAGEIWVSHGLARARLQYVVLHESAHLIPLTARQQLELMRLLEPPVQSIARLPRVGPLTANDRGLIRKAWAGGDYLWRPREAYPDDHVQAFTQPRLVSPFEGWYKRDTPRPREARLREVTLRELDEQAQDQGPSTPERIPDPTDPDAPDLERLLELVADLEQQLDDANLRNGVLELHLLRCSARVEGAIAELTRGDEVTEETQTTERERIVERTEVEPVEVVEAPADTPDEAPADTPADEGPDDATPAQPTEAQPEG